MWQCGIDTLDSCENDIPNGYIMIEFPIMFMMERFFRIIFEGIESENYVYHRACHSLPCEENAWLHDYFFVDDESDGTINEILTVHVLRFPQSDKLWICRKLKECLVKYDYEVPDTYNNPTA